MPSQTTEGHRDDDTIDDAWIQGHYERVHRAAWLMTGNAWEAEDLAQETFIVAIDRWDSFAGRSSESTWLYGILIRLNRRRGRSLQRMHRWLTGYAERADQDEAGLSDDPQTILAQKQWAESVWADVARLPPAQRDAVTLRFAEEMSYEQVADVLRCAVGTAKTRVHHGLRRLRQQATDRGSTETSTEDGTSERSQPDLHPTVI